MQKTTKLASRQGVGPTAKTDLVEGRYALQRKLGAGAQGTVWLASDVSDRGAACVIKVVPAERAAELQWEWEVLSRVQHPAIARVFELLRVSSAHPQFDLGVGAVLMVSDYAPGQPIDVALSAMSSEALLSSVVIAGFSVARALSAFHRAGLVHGDVKPSNVLIHEQTVRLIDPALAGAPSSLRSGNAVIQGTPAYLAPEAWRGDRAFAADSFALGVTLLNLLKPSSNANDSRHASGPSEWLRHALNAPERARELGEGIPEALRSLIAELVATEPGARPSAIEAASRLAALAQAKAIGLPLGGSETFGGGVDEVASNVERAAAATTLPLVGQQQALTTLSTRLEKPRVTRVIGADGSGRSRVIREAVSLRQATCVRNETRAPSYLCIEALPARMPAHDCVIHVTRADDGFDLAQCQALIDASALDGYALHVLLESDVTDVGVDDVFVAPLDRSGVSQLLHAALPQTNINDRWIDAALAASGGLAGRLCRVLSEVCAGSDHPRVGALSEAATRVAANIDVPEEARALACLIANAGGSLDAATVRAVLAEGVDVAHATHQLVALGLASVDGEGLLTLRHDVVSHARTLLPAQDAKSLSASALQHTTPPAARGYLLDASGKPSEAAVAWREAVAQLRTSGRVDAAAVLARGAMARVHDKGRAALGLELARTMLLLGRYGDVMTLLKDAATFDAKICLAEAQRRGGYLHKASETLTAAIALARERKHEVHAAASRVAFDKSDYASARSESEQAVASPGWSRARGLEVQALLALRESNIADARDYAERGLVAARDLEPAELARSMSVLAMVSLAGGDTSSAAQHYAKAYDLAERAGDVHGAALCLLNLGLTRVDRGEVGPGLVALREASRRLLRLGRESDAARAFYNVGNAATLVGDDELARSALALARRSERLACVPAVRAYALLCEADIAARAGQRERAETSLAELSSGDLLAQLSEDERTVALSRGAVIWCALGDVERARQWAPAVAENAVVERSPTAAAEHAMAHARLALAEGGTSLAVTMAERALVGAERAATFELNLRASLALAAAFDAAGRIADAARCYASARNLLDQVAAGLSPSERARLRQLSTYRHAWKVAPTTRVAGDTSSVDRWRKLASLSAQLVGEHRVKRLLDRVLDAAIELADAERGFVVTSSDGLRIRASRGLTDAYLSDASAPSRTFVTRVIGEGRPMASVDALRDDRLDGAASVHALSLRSVVAVPLRVGDHITGAIYLDDRLRPFAFGDEEVALLSRLADIAALALDAAERSRSERIAVTRLTRLRERLRKTVETQALEISTLRRTDETTIEHPTIIGRGVAMRALLAMVDRVSRSELPVLITGESGTGKELVARTIHDHGPRRGSAFVSENCSAIPETLLESALFGHVRGAFTGAERSRTGLFDAADGGTLFLDEIGEMSAGMQSRLLRVLQDGEIRSVGSERARNVDVRVIAATHRDLEQMVRAGSFREDLYYRLAVVGLKMPALRDRAEDIAELVTHFVRKHGGDDAARIDRKTLNALSKYAWPGNVRQLENEIRRALVLADGVVKPEHLSSVFHANETTPVDDLDLRGQTDLLERRLIRAALDHTQNNQTHAAKILGVSRFGLQKMMKRLGVVA